MSWSDNMHVPGILHRYISNLRNSLCCCHALKKEEVFLIGHFLNSKQGEESD